jgi:hypothetical protein
MEDSRAGHAANHQPRGAIQTEDKASWRARQGLDHKSARLAPHGWTARGVAHQYYRYRGDAAAMYRELEELIKQSSCVGEWQLSN